MINNKRPINLNLATIRFPLSAIVSILHRISGILLFIAVPVLLCAFDHSLRAPASFSMVQHELQKPIAKFWIWVIWATFTYHILAGGRHLIMDFGFWESKTSGRVTAICILLLTVVLILLEIWWLM